MQQAEWTKRYPNMHWWHELDCEVERRVGKQPEELFAPGWKPGNCNKPWCDMDDAAIAMFHADETVPIGVVVDRLAELGLIPGL